jgi:hypothetical protein
MRAPRTSRTTTPASPATPRTPVRQFLQLLHWLDGRPLLELVEPYRLRILETFLDTEDRAGGLQYSLGLCGRAKKNWKSCDLVLAALFACVANDAVQGNEVYLIANDEGQAGDDLDLLKKLIRVSPLLMSRLVITQKVIERRDGGGFIKILPGGDVTGAHGKTARLVGFDEIHGMRDWSLLSAMQLDPTRRDAQMLCTSYSSLVHRKGVPLYDLLDLGKRGADPKMFFSWYSGDYGTDPEFANLGTAELRANPSIAQFVPGYLETQRVRLPSHSYRLLHLNIGGAPEGAAYSAEIIQDAIARGVHLHRPPEGVPVHVFVDASGGSHDDFYGAGAFTHPDDGRAYLCFLVHQGAAPPFDPRQAVGRIAKIAKEFGAVHVVGDNYAGMTFVSDFAQHGLAYEVCLKPASQLYEQFEPYLNAGEVVLLDDPTLENQLISLVWKGKRIDHPAREHDDAANAAVGALLLALTDARYGHVDSEMNWEEHADLLRGFNGTFSLDGQGDGGFLDRLEFWRN